MTTTYKDLGLYSICEKIKKLSKSDVKVGLFDDIVYDKKNVSVAQVGFWNEYGTKRIPSVSFLEHTLNKNKKKYVNKLAIKLGAIYSNKITVIELLKEYGIDHAIDIRNRIIDVKIPENAESTVKIKGFDDRLVHTGLMRDSIRVLIEE